MGADGHIYRGRMQRLEAKMPIRMVRSAASNKQNTSEVSFSLSKGSGLLVVCVSGFFSLNISLLSGFTMAFSPLTTSPMLFNWRGSVAGGGGSHV